MKIEIKEDMKMGNIRRLVIQILKRSMDKPVDPMNRDCDSV